MNQATINHIFAAAAWLARPERSSMAQK